MPTVQVTKAELANLVARGLIREPGNKGKGKKGATLVEESFTGGVNPVWVVAVKTASEANTRGWQSRASRNHAAKKAVCAALGRHLSHVVKFAEAYHRGQTVRVIL